MANLLVSNDNDVYLQGYVLASNGSPVTDAVASFTAYTNNGEDEDGNLIQGPAISALTGIRMPPVFGVPGDYRGLISGTANLTAGAPYYIVVTFSNYNDSFSGWFTAAQRTPGVG